MQATSMGGVKLEKRYSPSFREEPAPRKMSASKRKRDEVLRMKVHKNGNAADVIKSISQLDNSNKQYDRVSLTELLECQGQYAAAKNVESDESHEMPSVSLL